MSFVRTLAAAFLVGPLLLVACDDGSMDEEDAASDDAALTGSALTGSLTKGAKLTTTARVNFREGPSTKEDIMRTLPVGTVVTALGGAAKAGFVQVSQGGDEGWVYSAYLKAGGSSSDTGTPLKPTNPSGGTSSSSGSSGSSVIGPSAGVGTGKIETCQASFYAEGQQTANGERFNPNELTAAHKTLKFNTMVRVTNKSNGKTVDVRINDRGPFVNGRCIDLSRAAFQVISTTSAGVASVTVEVLQ